MRDLAKILDDYVNGKLDPETEIEVDGLILQFVDGELDPERTAEIKAAMAGNPAVEASIAHSMRAAKTVQDELVPAYEAFKKQPNPDLDKALEELLADPNAWGKEAEDDAPGGTVLPLKPPASPAAAMRPTWGAMAASIATLLAIGGGIYLYDAGRDAAREQQIAALDAEIEQITDEHSAESDRLTRQAIALGIQLDEATQAREDFATQLTEAETAIEQLDAERVTLTADLAAARDEVTAAHAARDGLEEEIAALDAETRQEIEARVGEREALARQLAATETRLEEALSSRDNATEALAEARPTIDALNADRTELAEQLAAANESITAAEAERDRLELQLADLDTEKATLASQVAELDGQLSDMSTKLAAAAVARETAQAQLSAAAEESRERIAALEDELGEAKGEVAGLRQAGNMLLAETERLRREASWIGQVVAYHRFYAGSPREVEGSDDERLSEKALIKWFNNKLGRPFPVPELEGLDYVGGRVYPTNGAPTALIGYHDQFGRLTALCFSPAPGNQTTGLAEGEDGDLNLVYWEKGGFRYALVSWADFGLLRPLAEKLREIYGEET